MARDVGGARGDARARTTARRRSRAGFWKYLRAARGDGARGRARAGRRVVVVPGFLTGSDAYDGVARALARAIGDDARVRVAPGGARDVVRDACAAGRSRRF